MIEKCKCGLERNDENIHLFVNRTKSRPNATQCKKCYSIIRHKYYEKNKQEILKKKKEKLELNKDQYKEYYRIYYKNNKDKFNITTSKYKKKKRKNDSLYRLKENIRSNIGRTFRDNFITKKSKTFEILGCDLETFKIYIESKWEHWMSWDNYGVPKNEKIIPNKYWDIDHIIPISTAKNENDILMLNHYTNLQPLCSYYNRYVKR